MKRLLLVLAACSTPPAPAPAPAPAAAAGRVVTEHFHSDALGVDKAVVVYLPKGYDADPAKRWPVFYYLHGLTGTENQWTKGDHIEAAADALALPAIIVMPDGDDDFYIDSAMPIDYAKCMASGAGLFIPTKQKPERTCVKTRHYETYIIKDLIGWVDAHYRTNATRDGRAIAGLSMGGFGAMHLAMRHPDLFAAAASHSGALALLYKGPRPFAPGKAELVTDVASWGKEVGAMGDWIRNLFGPDIATWKQYDVVELAKQLPAGKLALYFDCGTEDDFGLHDNLRYVDEALTAAHVEHTVYLGPGRHDDAFWAARAPESLKFLRDHTK